MRRPGPWALPSQRRRSPSCTGPGSRGGGVAGSRDPGKVSVAPSRRRAGQERAPAGSVPPPVRRCSGSRAPQATRPAQPCQSQARPSAAPPARPGRSGGGEGRGGAGRGRTCLANRPDYQPPRPGQTARLNRAIPSALGNTPPIPAWVRDLGPAPSPSASRTQPGPRVAVSARLRRPSVLPDRAPSPAPRMSKTKSRL